MFSWFRRPIKLDHSIDLAKRRLTHSIVGITCAGKTDGGGAQVQAIMSAILLSKKTGIPYFHTPFSSVEHGEGPNEFALLWERAFNLGHTFTPPPLDIPQVRPADLTHHSRRYPIILSQEHYHGYADTNPDQYTSIVDDLRPNLSLPTLNNAVAPLIAIHVRRGDVAGDSERFTPNKSIANTISSLRSKYQNPSIHLYSEGRIGDFFGIGECQIHLNENIFDTISALMSADILVTAKSSLSYVAALFCQGTIYYTPFWHKPMSKWNILASDGNIANPGEADSTTTHAR